MHSQNMSDYVGWCAWPQRSVASLGQCMDRAGQESGRQSGLHGWRADGKAGSVSWRDDGTGGRSDRRTDGRMSGIIWPTTTVDLRALTGRRYVTRPAGDRGRRTAGEMIWAVPHSGTRGSHPSASSNVCSVCKTECRRPCKTRVRMHTIVLATDLVSGNGGRSHTLQPAGLEQLTASNQMKQIKHSMGCVSRQRGCIYSCRSPLQQLNWSRTQMVSLAPIRVASSIHL